MTANNGNSAATHFGRQVRKEREAHHWSLREMAARGGLDFTTLSKVENGKRPPNEALARACDRLFPERRGWFFDWYDESRQWAEVPPAFRSWAEVEERAGTLRDWYPGIITGLLQTPAYARAVLASNLHASEAEVTARLASRIERQRRVLERETPAAAWFIIDEMALYRCVDSPGVMAEQCAHLSAVARRPGITITVMPAVAHPGNESGFVIADSAAYAEHVVGGYVFTDEETVAALAVSFDILRGETYRVSESKARIGRMAETWTGVPAAIAGQTAGSASRRPRARA
jgi:DNA-binding XRE family transcriptional regulator